MKIVFSLLLLILQFSCAGTETGNPIKGDPSAGQCDGTTRSSVVGNCLPNPYARVLVGRITDKVVACTNRTAEGEAQIVYDSVFAQEGLQNELHPLTFKSFAELTAAYDQKLINVDPRAFTTCLSALENLKCDDEEFKSSFDIAQPTDFTSIHKILRVQAECKNIFSMKEAL